MLDQERLDMLKSLAEKLSTQDNEWTQNPIFWIRDKVRKYNSTEDADWVEVDEDCYVCESCQEFYNANPTRQDNRDCVNHFSNPDSDEPKCEWTSWLIEYVEEWTICEAAWFFLTREAAENHIKENAHHYNDPIAWCWHLWRNDEVLKLINLLFEITDVKKPHFYNQI